MGCAGHRHRRDGRRRHDEATAPSASPRTPSSGPRACRRRRWPSMLAEATGAEVDRAGRIATLPDLTLPGHPEVFAVGDMVTLEQPARRRRGRDAGQPARRATRSSVASDGDDEAVPFTYRDLGSVAAIGRFRAICSVGRLRLERLPGVGRVDVRAPRVPERVRQPRSRRCSAGSGRWSAATGSSASSASRTPAATSARPSRCAPSSNRIGSLRCRTTTPRRAAISNETAPPSDARRSRRSGRDPLRGDERAAHVPADLDAAEHPGPSARHRTVGEQRTTRSSRWSKRRSRRSRSASSGQAGRRTVDERRWGRATVGVDVAAIVAGLAVQRALPQRHREELTRAGRAHRRVLARDHRHRRRPRGCLAEKSLASAGEHRTRSVAVVGARGRWARGAEHVAGAAARSTRTPTCRKRQIQASLAKSIAYGVGDRGGALGLRRDRATVRRRALTRVGAGCCPGNEAVWRPLGPRRDARRPRRGRTRARRADDCTASRRARSRSRPRSTSRRRTSCVSGSYESLVPFDDAVARRAPLRVDGHSRRRRSPR